MKPLAGANAKGQPYVRPKGVEEEISAVLGWPLDRAFALAAEGHLRPQTLVYFMRNFRPNRPTPAYDRLVVAFFSRLQRAGQRLIRGLSEVDRERVDELVKDRALELMAQDRLDIFEMSFKTGAERLYLTELAKVRLRAATEVSREDLVKPGSDLTGEEVADAVGFADPSQPLAEARAMLSEVLGLLTEKEREAVTYVHALGLSELEAAERIACTDRNVRYLLASARRKALAEGKGARKPARVDSVKP